MEDIDKIYWIRAAMALVAGFLSAFAYIFYSPSEGISIGILFYLVSYYLVRFLGIREDAEKKITMKTIFINGLGTYIILWLFTWILLINLLL